MPNSAPDPIVEEIHRTRERLAEKHGDDVHSIVRALRAKQNLNECEYESFAPRPPAFPPSEHTEGAA